MTDLSPEWSRAWSHDSEDDWFIRLMNDPDGLGPEYYVEPCRSESTAAEASQVTLGIGAHAMPQTLVLPPAGPVLADGPMVYWDQAAHGDRAGGFFTSFELQFAPGGPQPFRLAYRTSFGVLRAQAQMRLHVRGPRSSLDHTLYAVREQCRRAPEGTTEHLLAVAAENELQDLARWHQADKHDVAVFVHPGFGFHVESKHALSRTRTGVVDYVPFVGPPRPGGFFACDADHLAFEARLCVQPGPSWVTTDGEQLEVTVLVCDLAGYTARAENATAKETLRLLQPFFSIVDSVVPGFGGVVAGRPGDAALVFFRSDGDIVPHTTRALQAAEALELRLSDWASQQGMAFGITLATGEVSLGWVGQAPPQPQIVGDPVNAAFRLQDECRERGLRILMDGGTARADREVTDRTVFLGEAYVKNREQPICLYTPAADRARD